jgi:uncharacterized membrane protein YoaK (UPF0700 family)
VEDLSPRPALLLAWVAGTVDGLGYLVLFHLFTANMTGNSVTMGTQLGEGYWVPALRSAFTIPIFLAGVAVGALVRNAVSRGSRRARPALLALELLLLAGFLVTAVHQVRAGGLLPGSRAFYGMAALATLAMGVQNAVPVRVRGVFVRTTYVTGTLTSLAEDAVAWIGARGASREAARSRALLWAGVWAAYVTGAVAGGFAEHRWGPVGVVLPLAGLSLLIARDLTRRRSAA